MSYISYFPHYSKVESRQELFLDMNTGLEKQLKRTVNHYDKHGNLIEEDVYDANDSFCYTLFKSFNKKGELISEKDPLGREKRYEYDVTGIKHTSTPKE